MSKRKGRIRNRIRSPTGKTDIRVKNTGYSEGGGGRTSNILKAWNPVRSSAKADIDTSLSVLRGRSADQAINSAVGAAAINTSALHAIGDGLKLSPRIFFKDLGLTAEKAKE